MHLFDFNLSLWIVLPAVFFAWVTVFYIVKKIVFHSIKKLVEKTTTSIDDIFFKAVSFPVDLMIVISGAAIIQPLIPFGENSRWPAYCDMGFKAATILTVIIFVDKLVEGFIQHYSRTIEILRSSSIIVQGFARLAIAGLGFLVLLDSLGVSITPIIASLGIGSLAVALAIKKTLENFFCGLQLITDQPVRVGHFIKLESGEEGYVQKIGWRSTWIKLPTNNVIIIPNSSLIESKIINYYYPEKALAVKIEVGVHYSSDLDHIERVTKEVAQEVMQQTAGGVPDFEPLVWFHTFDTSSINMTVTLQAKEFYDNYTVRHEFIKRLHKRYKQEGITIPYPIRAINYDQEKAFIEKGPRDVYFK